MGFITTSGGGGFITKFIWMLITVLTQGVDGKLAVRDDAIYNVSVSEAAANDMEADKLKDEVSLPEAAANDMEADELKEEVSFSEAAANDMEADEIKEKVAELDQKKAIIAYLNDELEKEKTELLEMMRAFNTGADTDAALVESVTFDQPTPGGGGKRKRGGKRQEAGATATAGASPSEPADQCELNVIDAGKTKRRALNEQIQAEIENRKAAEKKMKEDSKKKVDGIVANIQAEKTKSGNGLIACKEAAAKKKLDEEIAKAKAAKDAAKAAELQKKKEEFYRNLARVKVHTVAGNFNGTLCQHIKGDAMMDADPCNSCRDRYYAGITGCGYFSSRSDSWLGMIGKLVPGGGGKLHDCEHAYEIDVGTSDSPGDGKLVKCQLRTADNTCAGMTEKSSGNNIRQNCDAA